MEKIEVTRGKIINEITRIGHGDYNAYTDVGLRAVKNEPLLFQHLIAWNHKNGQVRDSKVALPVLGMRGDFDQELIENSIAHLCTLDPRNLMRAIRFHKLLGGLRVGGETITHTNGYPVYPGTGRMLKDAIAKYIRIRESHKGWWDKTALLHKKTFKEIYKYFHIKPSAHAQKVLFDGKRPAGSVFEAAYSLKSMTPLMAAGTILKFKLPFLVIKSAIPDLQAKPEIVLAIIEQMSGAEIVTNVNWLQSLGVFDKPELKAAFQSAKERALKDQKAPTLKSGKAAGAAKSKKAEKEMKKMQEEQLESLGGIDGNWLVLGDKSGSMHQSVEMAKMIAALIAKQVSGDVSLIFFNTMPTQYNVTGKTYDEIKTITRHERAGGGTSVGVGLDLILKSNIAVNGIAICSDGGENAQPYFHQVYKKYCAKIGIDPPVYLFHLPGETDRLTTRCQVEGIMIEKFDASRVDYYSLPNLIKLLKTSRYQLVTEVMDTPLLTLDEVFKVKEAA